MEDGKAVAVEEGKGIGHSLVSSLTSHDSGRPLIERTS
jgi:hypothetical protein